MVQIGIHLILDYHLDVLTIMHAQDLGMKNFLYMVYMI